jgi:hypothetical protein
LLMAGRHVGQNRVFVNAARPPALRHARGIDSAGSTWNKITTKCKPLDLARMGSHHPV